jgi:predicted nucleic acid-binding Zn ribbon protein
VKPIGSALSGALAQLLRGGPMSQGKLQVAWNAAVGPTLGRAAAVRLEGGVLLVDAASSQWAQEISRSSRLILGRLQQLLGPGVIASISIRTGK